MEVLILVLFYYLSQNPNFAESVKPLMNQIKDSEQMLKFLNDLSKFSEAFGACNPVEQQKKEQPSTPPPKKEEKKSEERSEENSEKKEDPQSPTSGIADDFIQSILDSYLKKT